MDMNSFVSIVGNLGFPVVITAYVLIKLEKQLAGLTSSINKLNTIVSAKLGVVIDTGDHDNHHAA